MVGLTLLQGEAPRCPFRSAQAVAPADGDLEYLKIQGHEQQLSDPQGPQSMGCCMKRSQLCGRVYLVYLD